MALKPGKCLEKTIRLIDFIFKQARTPYWLHFGGLIGLAKKGGIIPDGDLDLCTFYESNDQWKRIVKLFESRGWVMIKALKNDIDPDKILYCGFNWKQSQTIEEYASEDFMPHICLSFWYKHEGIRYYCHDQNREVKGGAVETPPSGFFFKGFEDKYIEDDTMLMRAEWPGIPGNVKISVPILPCLEQMYPGYIYNQQRYMVQNNTIQNDKLRDCCRTGAISRYQVHVKSMAQWNDKAHIKNELEKSERNWRNRLKLMKKK